MVTNNTLFLVVDNHTREIEATRRDLAQLNTIVNARMEKLEASMNANMAAMQSQIEKLTTII